MKCRRWAAKTKGLLVYYVCILVDFAFSPSNFSYANKTKNSAIIELFELPKRENKERTKTTFDSNKRKIHMKKDGT